MIDWLSAENLMLDEFLSLISKYKNKMESMEAKNQWDLRINESPFWVFVKIFFCFMEDEVPQKRFYPKVSDFYTLWTLCQETKEQDSMYTQMLIDRRDLNICDVVIEWIISRAKDVLNDKKGSL